MRICPACTRENDDDASACDVHATNRLERQPRRRPRRMMAASRHLATRRERPRAVAALAARVMPSKRGTRRACASSRGKPTTASHVAAVKPRRAGRGLSDRSATRRAAGRTGARGATAAPQRLRASPRPRARPPAPAPAPGAATLVAAARRRRRASDDVVGGRTRRARRESEPIPSSSAADLETYPSVDEHDRHLRAGVALRAARGAGRRRPPLPRPRGRAGD